MQIIFNISNNDKITLTPTKVNKTEIKNAFKQLYKYTKPVIIERYTRGDLVAKEIKTMDIAYHNAVTFLVDDNTVISLSSEYRYNIAALWEKADKFGVESALKTELNLYEDTTVIFSIHFIDIYNSRNSMNNIFIRTNNKDNTSTININEFYSLIKMSGNYSDIPVITSGIGCKQPDSYLSYIMLDNSLRINFDKMTNYANGTDLIRSIKFFRE